MKAILKVMLCSVLSGLMAVEAIYYGKEGVKAFSDIGKE